MTFVMLMVGAIECYGQTPSTWHDNTFMIMFDENTIDQDEIDAVRNEFKATEEWKSPLTNTRLWRVDPPFVSPSGQYFHDVEAVVQEGRKRSGGQGGAGLNFNLSSVNPLSSYSGQADVGLDCYRQINTSIPTGRSEVSLAILDTGASDPLEPIQPYHWHLAPAGSITGENQLDPSQPYTDWQGHGNHLMSSAHHLIYHSFAKGLSGKPKLETRIQKVFNNDGVGTTAAILYAFEKEVEAGTKIFNFSWRYLASPSGSQSHPLYNSLKTASFEYDVLIVCAAGNDGLNLDSGEEVPPTDNCGSAGNPNGLPNNLNAYPASYTLDNILTVTTSDCNDGLSCFVNRGGLNVDVAAPGNNIPGYWTDNYGNNGIEYYTGTSMSTAIVSAGAVQLATLQDNWDAQEIICAIVNGADPLSDLKQLCSTRSS